MVTFKKVKLSAKALKQLRNDPRMQELFYNLNMNGELNTLEEIMVNQMVEEAANGTL